MAEQEHHDSIREQLSMFGQSSTEGTVTGGTFAFAEADMVRIKQNWLDLADSYQGSLDNADRMSKIKAPAEDMASKFHVTAANSSGDSYRTYLEHNRDYCRQQADLFGEALADYRGTEDTNVTGTKRLGREQGPQTGF